MADYHLGASTYRVMRKPDLFKQADILARVSPLMSSGFVEFVPLWMIMQEEGIQGAGRQTAEYFARILTPIARELAKMSDADRRFIIGSCLDMLDRREDGREGWARVWDADAGRAMFADVQNDIGVAIRLCLFVLQETFGSFLPERLSAFLRALGALTSLRSA